MRFFGLPSGWSVASEPDFFVFEAKFVVYFLYFLAPQEKNKSVKKGGFEPRKRPQAGGFREMRF